MPRLYAAGWARRNGHARAPDAMVECRDYDAIRAWSQVSRLLKKYGILREE